MYLFTNSEDMKHVFHYINRTKTCSPWLYDANNEFSSLSFANVAVVTCGVSPEFPEIFPEDLAPFPMTLTGATPLTDADF